MMKKGSWLGSAAIGSLMFGLILAAPQMSEAQMYIKGNQAVGKKYLKLDKFNRVTDVTSAQYKMVMTSGGGTCDKKLLECPLGIEAIKGTPDPAYKELFKDLATTYLQDGKPVFTFSYAVKDIMPLGMVLWNPADAGKLLTSLIGTLKQVDELISGGKNSIYQALWYLGDPANFDAMFKWFHNVGYDKMHTLNSLMVLHTWPLNADQKGKLEKFCMDMFQGQGALPKGQGREKDVVVPCLRHLGLAGSKNKELSDYIENYLGGPLKGDAARTAGGMGLKGLKGALKKILNEHKAERTVKKKKVKYWRPRKESVAAAVALIGMGDADAKKAIAYWLAVDTKDKRLNDTTGFEMTFFEAPWASDASLAKLKPMLLKAFKAADKLGKSDENMKLYATRAAIALSQAGLKDGFKLIAATLAGSNKDLRGEAIIGMGGHTNYYGSYRTGTGGFKIGKKALGKKEIAEIEKTIFKKMKFWSNRGEKESAMRAILDLRARAKMAGL